MRLDGKPIPGWAEPYVDWMVGQDWPEGDEERCFRLADACVAAAHRIVTKTEAGPVMSDEKTGRTWDGAAHAAFAEHVAGAVGGREAELVVRLVGTAIAINDAGVRVRNARHTIEATVRLAVAQLGHLLAAAMTGDASTLALVSARLRLARLTVAHIGERTLNDIALSTAVTGDAVPAGGLALAGQDHRDALDARRPAASTLAELADHVTAADDVITEERSAAERHIGGEAPGVPDTDGRYLAPFLYPGLMYTGLMGGGPYGGATSPSRSPAGRRAAAVPSSPDHPTGRSAPAVPPWPGSASSAALTTDRRSSAGRSSTAAASSSAPTRSSAAPARSSAAPARSSAASARDTTPGHASAPGTARPFFGLDLDLIRRSVSAPAVTPGASRTGRPRRTPRPVPRTDPEARQPAETEPRPGAAIGAEPAAEAGSGSGSGSGSGAGTGTGTEAQGMAAQGTAEATASDPSYNKVQEALTPAADEPTSSVPPGGSAPAKPSASTSVSPAPEPSSTSEVPSPGPSSASGAPSPEPSAAGPSARESPASGSPAPKRPRVRWKRRR
ncbi:WXG100-like domain-containing protein [Streptosporangium sandarakinum]|uniref:WXG100-like domain-containing protein n=1 Tax=Streptosporangium sandarakinum TaxID=1260955 RepID=UPI0036BF986D